MERVFFNGQMAKFMKVNGLMEKNMVVGCGKILKDKAILESGKMESHKDLGYMSQNLVTCMRDSFKILINKDLELKDTVTVKRMWENIEKTVLMGKGNTFGEMGITTKDNLSII